MERSNQSYKQLELFPKETEIEEWFALTIDPPYGDWLLEGIKIWETRGTKTECPKRIFIHTSRKKIKDSTIKRLARESLGENYEPKYGHIIGTGVLIEVVTMTKIFIKEQTENEIKLGHWKVGRKGWKLNELERIEPVPAIGCQGCPWSIDNSKLNPNLRRDIEKTWRRK
jgi:hypothetical protein